VVLTGIHLGGYGLDLDPATNLLELLTAAEAKRLVPRLRVGSVEPMEVSSGLIRLLAGAATLCPHLHIPLQSGSDPVLGRMNRGYTTDDFRAVIDQLANAVPGICIGCDVIAGFPGETEADFAAGLRFIDSLPIAYLHVFPFSSRPGTPAAAMSGQVAPGIIRERAAALRELGERKRQAFYQSLVGETLQVLVQEEAGPGLVRGLSRNYVPVTLPGDESLVGSEAAVRVIVLKGDGVRGEMAGA
jgi:threonylcarbamoyladenosine tRNA methylthiotransferase MtaB